MTDDIVTRPEQEIDFVEYLRLWASPDGDDQAVRDLHKAADEIERLRADRDQALADLHQAREAIGGVRAALRQKLEAAWLNQRCDQCPLDANDEDEDDE